MDCGGFRNKITPRVGGIFLDADEKSHLERCPECRELYEKSVALENDLRSLKVKPLGAVEFAAMQQILDENINRYQRRAVSFYNLFTRYGAGLITVTFLLFVSLWSGFEYGVYYADNAVQSDMSYLADNDYEEDETMNDEYIELLLYDYIQDYGFDSGELLLGDLTQEEFNYLEDNFDMGDIL